MMPAADGFGPWSDDIDAAERRACVRSLGAITRLYRGPRADRLADELHMAERDTGRVPTALAAFNALAPLDRRQELSSFARLHRPA